MKNRILILIALQYLCLDLTSQQIQQFVKPNGYRYKNQFLHFDDLKQTFAQDPEALQYLNRYQVKKRDSKVMGFASLILITGGLIGLGIANFNDAGPYSLRYNYLSIPLAMIIVSPLPLLSSIALNLSAKKLKNKAIDAFNMNQGLSLSQKEEAQLAFSLSANGIGLSVKF